MKTFFETQKATANEAEQVARLRFNTLALARTGIFLAFLIALWIGARVDTAAYWVAGIALVAFLLLMRKQDAVRRERDYQRNVQTVNEDEGNRLSFIFNREDTGLHYLEKDHGFAGDLDIFGSHSLYRLLNRTQTAEGSARLAEWLVRHASLEEVLQRQEAVKESRSDAAWRQHWQATALLHPQAAQQIGGLRTWVTTPMDPALRKGLRWKWWAVVTVVLLLGWILQVLPFWPAGFALVGNGLIVRRYGEKVKLLTGQTYQLGRTLVAYAELLGIAEVIPFRTRWWKARQNQGASKALRQLGGGFSRLDFRLNAFFTLFVGFPLLWDLICLDFLEKWKEKHQGQLARWLACLADIEALNSLAGYAFADPELTLPQVAWSDALEIRAREMGHPLIPAAKRVRNDFELCGTGHTVLITGSNMSGKSTFLRTVGLNLVLAQAGSVVPARQLTCSQLRVFSSMRTLDSLEESTSSFYAELKRLRRLLETAGEDGAVPVFYLLDEILKGTNSADRHRGAEALIRQLHPLPASGMVSTHDLELGEWGESQAYVHNYHFRSEIESGELRFDYRLHKGICQSFNASALMRMMGINIGPDGEK